MGGFFDFDSSPNDSVAGTVADVARSAARDEATARLSDPSPRRRRRRSQENNSAGERDPVDVSAEVRAALIQQIDALHDPRAWGALVAFPGDVMQTITGKERWKISDKERETLGATSAAAARTFMITNPRALACTMAAFALITVYMPRIIEEIKERNAAQKKPKPVETNVAQPAA